MKITVSAIRRLTDSQYLSTSENDSVATNNPYGYPMGSRPYIVNIRAFGWNVYACDESASLVARRAVRHIRHLLIRSWFRDSEYRRMPRRKIAKIRRRLNKEARNLRKL